MASTQPTHDPAFAQVPPSAPGPAQGTGAQPTQGGGQPTLPANLIATMGPEQIAALLKQIPDLLTRVSASLVSHNPLRIPQQRTPLHTPFVALECVGHALHVIEGIGHVRRRDRGGRAGRVGGVHPAVTWGVLCLIALHDAL